MAYIKLPQSEQIVHLRNHHTFGRDLGNVDTFLDFKVVSKLHAHIEWKEPYWLITDLSRNGIWVNQKRIKPNVSFALKVGDLVEISGSEEASFEIVDLSPPCNMVYREYERTDWVAIDTHSLIPNETTPDFGLHKCADRQQWFSEVFISDDYDNSETPNHENGPLEHGDIVKCSGNSWVLSLLKEIEEDEDTLDVTSTLLFPKGDIRDVELRAVVSADEKKVQLSLRHGRRKMKLEARHHHHLIVELIRNRTEKTKGWVDFDLLGRKLGINQASTNVQLFRARRQLSLALPGYEGHSRIIERRAKGVRLGFKKCSVYKNGVREKSK